LVLTVALAMEYESVCSGAEPRSLKKAVERLSKEDGTSINQFVTTAVAEKVSALQTARFFQERKARVDFEAFDKIMNRRGGRPARKGDEMP